MDLITLARELGAELQKSEIYTAHKAANEAADADGELQNLIADFNEKKAVLSQEVQKTEKDQDAITALNEEVKSIYGKIMNNENMVQYNVTKGAMDKQLNFIQQIIVYAANGEDPYAVEESEACGGSCSSCSGCG